MRRPGCGRSRRRRGDRGPRALPTPRAARCAGSTQIAWSTSGAARRPWCRSTRKLMQAGEQAVAAAAGERLPARAVHEDLGERQHVELGDPRVAALEGDEAALVEQDLAEANL